MKPKQALGWSMGKDKTRFYDETGLFHLILAEGETGCRSHCGAVTGGQLEQEPLYSHKCLRCEAAAKKLVAQGKNS